MHADLTQQQVEAQCARPCTTSFSSGHACRHIFSEKQYVEEYRSQDFPSELGVDRQKLIYLALLLGSDYTEGIAGIGIVNAVSSCSSLFFSPFVDPPPLLPAFPHCQWEKQIYLLPCRPCVTEG